MNNEICKGWLMHKSGVSVKKGVNDSNWQDHYSTYEDYRRAVENDPKNYDTSKNTTKVYTPGYQQPSTTKTTNVKTSGYTDPIGPVNTGYGIDENAHLVPPNPSDTVMKGKNGRSVSSTSQYPYGIGPANTGYMLDEYGLQRNPTVPESTIRSNITDYNRRMATGSAANQAREAASRSSNYVGRASLGSAANQAREAADRAAEKARANHEWYEKNKAKKREYNARYYRENSDEWLEPTGKYYYTIRSTRPEIENAKKVAGEAIGKYREESARQPRQRYKNPIGPKYEPEIVKPSLRDEISKSAGNFLDNIASGWKTIGNSAKSARSSFNDAWSSGAGMISDAGKKFINKVLKKG